MTEQEFVRLLERWGGDFARWPDAGQAAAAQALMERGGAARRAWEQAGRLDAALAEAASRPAAARLDRLEGAILARLDLLAEESAALEDALAGAVPPGWFEWLTAPRGAVLVGLFLLGCLTSLMVRQAGPAPFDLMFVPAVLAPLGG